MQEALAELAERYDAEINEDATEVDLEEKGLPELPLVVCQLQAVEELFLDNNALLALPDAIGNMAALRELNARQNRLVGLPDSIGKLKALEGLFLGRNCLESLPDLSGCSAACVKWPLRSVCVGVAPDARARDLQAWGVSVPTRCAGWSHFRLQCRARPPLGGSGHPPLVLTAGAALAGINVSLNRLRSLPDGLCQCARMEGLFGDENEIEELPEDFGAMGAPDQTSSDALSWQGAVLAAAGPAALRTAL